MQLYTTGIATVARASCDSRWEQGRDERVATRRSPSSPRQGLNTYRVPLKKFAQPSWVTDTRVDPKDVMKQLTLGERLGLL